MKNNNYYIVALNENNARIVNLNNEILQEKNTNKLINIAYIDLITSKYDEKTFREHLLKKKIIDDYYTPIFIVHKTYSHDTNHPYSKTNIHYFNPIFKGKYSNYIDNIAITTLRNRLITVEDSGIFIILFSRLYYCNNELYDIANEIVGKETIDRVVAYKEKPEKFKKSPINYIVIRNMLSSLLEYEKYSTYQNYMVNTYDKELYDDKIANILPKNKVIKKQEIRNYSKEELNNIKNSKWDNELAKEEFSKPIINITILNTLTLEDRLRAGLIDELEYENTRKDKESKYRR